MAASGIRCPNCSSLNRPGARFCSQCRSPLDETSPTAGRGYSAAPLDSASSFEVPPVPDRSASRSYKGLIVGAVVLVALLAAVGYWYFGLQGESLEGLPLVGAAPTQEGSALPTILAAPATLISSGDVATVVSGGPSTLKTRVSGALKTLTTTPPATAAPGTASAATATPAPDALVIVDSANLRAGPATLFDVLGVLHQGDPLQVLGRNRIGDWLHVQTQKGQTGWVATSLVKLNLELDKIQVDKAIPTPPPGQPPAVPPVMPLGQGCPPGPALVSITNAGGPHLIIMLQGARNYVIDLVAGQTKNVCLVAGPYQFLSTATSGGTEQGAKLFTAGAPVCWSLPSTAGQAPCNPPSDPAVFTSPPGGELPLPAGFR